MNRLATALSLCLLVAIACVGLHAQQRQTPQQLFDQATQALKSGDYAAAESSFRAVLKADPRNIGALGNLGVIYSKTHRFSKAVDVYKQALQLAPRDPNLQLNLGLAYVKQDDYAHALPYFRKVHAVAPANVQATQLLATCFVRTKQPQAAIDLLKPLAEQNSDPGILYLLAVAYIRAGQADAGKQVFEKLLTTGTTKAQSGFLLAEAYLDSQKYEEALPAFQEVERLDSKLPGLHREMGKTYLGLNRYPDAEKEMRVALEQDPQDEQALYYLGGLLVQDGRYKDGIPYLERIYRSNPDSWTTCFYLGKAELKLDNHEASIRYLQKAADLNPNESMIFYFMGTALRAAGRQQEAKAAFARVSQLRANQLETDRKVLRDANVIDMR